MQTSVDDAGDNIIQRPYTLLEKIDFQSLERKITHELQHESHN